MSPTECHFPEGLYDSYVKTLKVFDDIHAVFRLWAKDASLFTGKDESLMLDWLDEPRSMLKTLNQLKEIQQELRDKNFSHTVLLGMGGSSLAAKVFQQILKPQNKSFFVVDTIHPDTIHRLLQNLDLKKTLFIVASKSGSTLEPNLLYRYFLSKLMEEHIADPFGHFMAITDPISSLEQESSENGFLRGPYGKPGIGGRYSALSPFGIMPALLMGIDVERLLGPAVDMALSSGPTVLAKDITSANLAAFLSTSFYAGHDQLIIHLSHKLYPLGMWMEQLIAESLGKDGKGLLPIVAKPNEFFLNNDTTKRAAHVVIGLEHELLSLADLVTTYKNAPVFRLPVKDLYDIGALMYCLEMAVALTGSMLKINPFDQPDVEKSKAHAKKIISELAHDQDSDEPYDMSEFLRHINPTDYVAVLSYLDETPENLSLLDGLSSTIANNGHVAVIEQTGPRYLHSTGQLFKGGKNNGHFLVITGPYAHKTMSVDGLSMADVHLSQALGDMAAMRESGRRVLHIALKKSSDLSQLTQKIKGFYLGES